MEPLNAGDITPFHTFDPLQGSDVEELVDILESSRTGGVDSFATLAKTHPLAAKKLEVEGAVLSNGRIGIEWDDATILFIALRATESDGSPAEPLDRGISMERLGRFPTTDGNAIAYLRKNLIPETEDDLGSQLLKQLDAGFRNETRGHDNLSNGFGGLSLHGWLTVEDVGGLRSHLQKSVWKVAKNEKFDGGVRDVVRHLIIVMKTAEKRGMGILMRSHD